MKNIFLFAVLATLLLAPFASATVSEVTAEASSSSVTTGTSVTVTSTVTATGSETSSVQMISSPSGITVSDPASGSYSSVAVSTTPVTKTFTITAGSAGTYTYYAQAGSTQSTAKTIVFSDPSVLTITGDSSAVSKTSGQTLTLSISLANSQSSAITSSYSLNLPSSYYSVSSGDPQTSTGRSFAVGTTTLSWTIAIASGASSGTVTFQLGSNTNAFSKSVTIPSPSSSSTTTTTTTTTTTSSDGTTSTTVIDLKANKVAKTFSSVSPNVMRSITETELKDTKTGLMLVEFSAKKIVTNVKLTVQKLESKPASILSDPVSASGNVYKYINITKENLADADMDKAKIKFKVDKSWLIANNFTTSQIALKRYVSQWELLNTTMTSQDNNYSYYTAQTPGFSIFAVSADKDIATPIQQQEQPPQPPVPEEKPLPEKKPLDMTFVYVSIAIIAALGILIYFAKYKKKKQR